MLRPFIQFLMLGWPPTRTLFPWLLQNCNFAAFTNHNVNICVSDGLGRPLFFVFCFFRSFFRSWGWETLVKGSFNTQRGRTTVLKTTDILECNYFPFLGKITSGFYLASFKKKKKVKRSVMYVYNSRIWKVEAGGLPWVQGQPTWATEWDLVLTQTVLEQNKVALYRAVALCPRSLSWSPPRGHHCGTCGEGKAGLWVEGCRAPLKPGSAAKDSALLSRIWRRNRDPENAAQIT